MKKSKFITCIALLLLIVMCFSLSGCNLFAHKHSYPAVYEKDYDYHWKTCKSCDNVVNRAPHNFDEWIVDEEPTETVAGRRHARCTVCGFVKSESIDPIGEQHHYSGVYVNYSPTLHYRECIDVDCGYRDYSNHNMGSWTIDVPATTTSTGHKYRNCNLNCGYQEEQTLPQLSDKQATGTVDFYAINDFHGAYEKLSQISGYISNKLNNGNTVAINSGDMFQGSIQSNSNYGKLFTNCMDVAGFDAFVYGNHEFDWGLDNLLDLSSNSTVPFLGANIYKWNANTKTWGEFADDLAEKYVIKELDNGIKVGIIGVIGEDQITSISSQLVQTIGFKDPLPIIKELASELRNEQNCDIVVVSAHASPQGIVGEDETYDAPTNSAGLSDYVDAVFCAHSHSQQNYLVDGIPFIQGGSSGNYVSHVQLSVDGNGNVTCDDRANIYYNNLSGIDTTVKNKVQALIDASNALIADEANEKIATLSGSLNKGTAIPRLVCHAMAEYATSQGYSIDLAICNTARADLSSGSVTYTNLYKALPFDNVIYIARVTGAEIYNEVVKYGQSMWRVSTSAIENSSSKYYTIAVIDYLLFHQNTNRSYNYFASAFYSSNTFKPVALTKTGVDLYHYRLITRDFMKAQGTINSTLYTGTNNHTNSSNLTKAVTF